LDPGRSRLQDFVDVAASRQDVADSGGGCQAAQDGHVRPLAISVDQDHSATLSGKGHRQVHGQRGYANAGRGAAEN
jgi:hypothetical protein